MILVTVGIAGCKDQEAQGELGLIDLAGRRVAPFEGSDRQATVFLFLKTDCPISNRYAPEIQRLERVYGAQGVVIWLVYPDNDTSAEAIVGHVNEYRLPNRIARDPQHQAVRMSGATVTPEAALFSTDRKLVYRGRIDNRYVDFGKTRPEPTRYDLEEAIKALLDGRPIEQARTKAVGCCIPDLKE